MSSSRGKGRTASKKERTVNRKGLRVGLHARHRVLLAVAALAVPGVHRSPALNR